VATLADSLLPPDKVRIQESDVVLLVVEEIQTFHLLIILYVQPSIAIDNTGRSNFVFLD
jgi:hypothetical protein